MKNEFIHLHLHTSYSLDSGIIKIDKLIDYAKTNKISSLAITDHSNISNAIKFYQKCIEKKIKPIIGCEIPITTNYNHSYFPNIVLLCKNIDGYNNLIKLITEAHTNKQANQKPSTTINKICELNQGLIMLTGGRNGLLGRNLLTEKIDIIKKDIQLISEFYKDRLYCEIERTSRLNEDIYNNHIINIADDLNLPIVASNDVLFMNSEDFETNETKVCINRKIKLDDRNKQTEFSDQQYFKSNTDMDKLFSDIPDAIENASHITRKCNLHIDTSNYYLPSFVSPKDMNNNEYFSKLAMEGLKTILDIKKIKNRENYIDRLQKEINVIQEMKFTDYFLIVQEFISWSKKNSIPVGPGRGSGAGSLVAYALGITTIDPVKYDLLFERFLNIERKSLPDFDIDFCMLNRQKVIDHIIEVYGESKVSQIITFNSLSARRVIRDVGRVQDLAYTFVDRIAKQIPALPVGITIDEALAENKDLQKEYTSNKDIKHLIDTSKKLEGLPANAGKHAAGIVITPDKINRFLPLYRIEESDELVTQLDKDDIEKLGLVKFDILGLRTLTVINKTVKAIKNKSDHVDFHIDKINFNDKKVFNLFQNKQTTGVFQSESYGIRRYMGRMKPDCFNDIVALVALYRPGPLGTNMVDDFISNKHGKEIQYEHDLLQTILSSTYGLILYQEQVMEISRSLAGYTLGEADLLRRAMGKKKKKEMETHRIKFLNGAKKKGISSNVAHSIFSKMEKFAGYGFNKSHSVAYAYLAYQTAYLKTYFPAEFLAACLSSNMDNTDKIINLVHACSEINIKVKQPDINESNFDFTTVNDNNILFGLGAIKGVGATAVAHIIEERNKNGSFLNIFDFCERISSNIVNTGTLESLIYSGSFDEFNANRNLLINLIDKAISFGQNKQDIQASGQKELFSNNSKEIVNSNVISINQAKKDTNLSSSDRLKLFSSEKKVIGFYLTGHPIQEFSDEIDEMSVKNIKHYYEKINSNEIDSNTEEHSTITGVITNIRRQRSGKDKFMYILMVDDSTSRLQIVVYDDVYEKYKSMIHEDHILFFTGTITLDDFDNQLSFKATRIFDIETARLKYSKKIELLLESNALNNDLLKKIVHILEPYKHGSCPLSIKYISEGHLLTMKELDNDWHVTPSTSLINNLRDLLGKENILVKYQ
ncbi:MAG: DNA polymerase III subunit alpha [Gammaproteobacteria bacterium]|nr:DNA polymerase III subunit alpha [Gammaproteobacteria bacterium]|tara:strand:- start:35098 stop:38583 length:3486 start_codon:yes stop_codon:yes gene_type:complete